MAISLGQAIDKINSDRSLFLQFKTDPVRVIEKLGIEVQLSAELEAFLKSMRIKKNKDVRLSDLLSKKY